MLSFPSRLDMKQGCVIRFVNVILNRLNSILWEDLICSSQVTLTKIGRRGNVRSQTLQRPLRQMLLVSLFGPTLSDNAEVRRRRHDD
jgi:hypothetical protein